MQYRNFDTSRKDGTYVELTRVIVVDDAINNEAAVRESDEGVSLDRIDAWIKGEWYYVGIRARATVHIVRNGIRTIYNLESAGLWGIESDAGDNYFNEVYREERESLLADMIAFARFEVVSG